jgi:hypothetical protein
MAWQTAERLRGSVTASSRPRHRVAHPQAAERAPARLRWYSALGPTRPNAACSADDCSLASQAAARLRSESAVQFTLDDVHPHPDRLWNLDVWEYVVFTEALQGCGWVHLSVAARERLGDRDRLWIVGELNRMAAHTSYGVTCADLLRKVRVPDPPGA